MSSVHADKHSHLDRFIKMSVQCYDLIRAATVVKSQERLAALDRVRIRLDQISQEWVRDGGQRHGVAKYKGR